MCAVSHRKEKNMKHLFVIAGHGAGDPGATGNGYTEAERVRALAKKIGQLGGANVTLGDMNRNYYADKGISSLSIPKEWAIVELHIDSGAKTARGGHVIIKAGYAPDKYDEALASLLKEILPGRSELIVGRSDLANPNRAAARGYNYRLIEFGFISSAEDMKVFNSRMDDIARGVLQAFGIPVSPKGKPEEVTCVNAIVQGNTGEDCMRLELKDAGDGYFYIRDKAYGLYLDVAGGASKDGTNVQFYKGNKTDAQKWKLIWKNFKNAKYLMLSPKCAPGKYLSVENNGVGGKNNLKLWSDLNNSKQKFFVREETDGYTLLIHAFTFKCVSAKE